MKVFITLNFVLGSFGAFPQAYAMSKAKPVIAVADLDQLANKTISCEFSHGDQSVPAELNWSGPKTASDGTRFYTLCGKTGLSQEVFTFGCPKVSVDTVTDLSEHKLRVVDAEGSYSNELDIDFANGTGMARQWGDYAGIPGGEPQHHFHEKTGLKNCTISI